MYRRRQCISFIYAAFINCGSGGCISSHQPCSFRFLPENKVNYNPGNAVLRWGELTLRSKWIWVVQRVDGVLHPDPHPPLLRPSHLSPSFLEQLLLKPHSAVPPWELPSVARICLPQDCSSSQGTACGQWWADAGIQKHGYLNSIGGNSRVSSQLQSSPEDRLRPLSWLHHSSTFPSANSCFPYTSHTTGVVPQSSPQEICMQISASRSTSREVT